MGRLPTATTATSESVLTAEVEPTQSLGIQM